MLLVGEAALKPRLKEAMKFDDFGDIDLRRWRGVDF
jgi:hypothetical protein